MLAGLLATVTEEQVQPKYAGTLLWKITRSAPLVHNEGVKHRLLRRGLIRFVRRGLWVATPAGRDAFERHPDNWGLSDAPANCHPGKDEPRG